MSNMPDGAESFLSAIYAEEETEARSRIFSSIQLHDHKDDVIRCFWQGMTPRKNAILTAKMWAVSFLEDDTYAQELAELYSLDYIHAYAILDNKEKFEPLLEEKIYSGVY